MRLARAGPMVPAHQTIPEDLHQTSILRPEVGRAGRAWILPSMYVPVITSPRTHPSNKASDRRRLVPHFNVTVKPGLDARAASAAVQTVCI